MADNPKNRYTAYSTKSSEEFNAASRNVKAGMIVSNITADLEGTMISLF